MKSIVLSCMMLSAITVLAKHGVGVATQTANENGVAWSYQIDDGEGYDAESREQFRGRVWIESIPKTTKGVLVVPAVLGGRSVVGIDAGAFSGCRKITAVLVCEGVERIWDYAFDGCSKLTTVVFPSTLRSMANSAMQNCESLTEVYYQGNAPAVSDNSIYYDCPLGLTTYALAGTSGWGDSTIWLERTIASWDGTPPNALAKYMAMQFTDVWKKARSFTLPLWKDGACVGVMSVKVGKASKKGEVSVGGSIMALNGTTLSGKRGRVFLHRNALSFDLSLRDGSIAHVVVDANGMAGEWNGATTVDLPVGGAVVKDARFYLADPFPGIINGGVVNMEYLPSGEPVKMDGRRWTLASAASIKYVKDKTTGMYGGVVNNGKNDPSRTNLSGLKLVYSARTGLFKGRFTVYTLLKGKLKKVLISVVGLWVGEEGYGTAELKNVGSWRVLIQ